MMIELKDGAFALLATVLSFNAGKSLTLIYQVPSVSRESVAVRVVAPALTAQG
jgi:hypothetical protein